MAHYVLADPPLIIQHSENRHSWHSGDAAPHSSKAVSKQHIKILNFMGAGGPTLAGRVMEATRIVL